MFEELTEKFEQIFKRLKGQGKLTESNIRDAMREIRRSLLEADVNYQVARSFIKNVEGNALGKEVLARITPGQMIVKIVHEELVRLLGGTAAEMNILGSPEVIIVCGLQGSGKTTSVAKLAYLLRKRGKRVLVSSVDIHRPAAIEQLRILAEKHDIPHALSADTSDPLRIARMAREMLESSESEILIMDTAGRMHLDDEMMRELTEVIGEVKPHHVLFVADGMTGQDAVNAVEGFMEYVTFDGVILTKIDGDARGGAALSIREVTGKPILFVGNGERIDAFDSFHPDRFASRILGMGDIVSYVEKAQEMVDEKQADKLRKKMLSEGLTLEDFLEQIRQIQKMGSIEQLMSMIPGVGKAMKGLSFSENELKHVEAIILSMTPKERRSPSIINGSRRKRIALGSGTTIQEVNNLLKQFGMMQKMMKKMSKFGGGMPSLPGMKLPFKMS